MFSLIIVSAVVIFVYMTFFYLIAQAIRDNSIVDIGWGLGFVLVTTALILYSDHISLKSMIITAMIFLWGIRLSLHIYLRNKGKKEDFRYAEWREQWGKKAPFIAFFKVFMLQGLVMLIISLPVISLFAADQHQFTWINAAGIIVFLGGYLIEVIGDRQLNQFKKQEKNKGKILQSGLWKFTRHPNYFGEAVLWWGIFLTAAGAGYEYITVISPITISLLLRYGSGVPMLEEKYKKRKDFKEYAERTPVFVPFVGKKGV